VRADASVRSTARAGWSRADSRALQRITEDIAIQLILISMQNRAFGPYLAAMHRNLNPVMEVGWSRNTRGLITS
jgi:hypothetical protein